MGEPKTARLATRIDPAVKAAAQEIADKQDRSLSWFVETALKRAIRLEDKMQRPTANRS